MEGNELRHFKEHERAEWDLVAQSLSSVGPMTVFAVTAGAADPLLRAVQLGPGTRLLDVACGPGEWLDRALAGGARVTAVDISEAMVAEAQRRYPSVTCRAADAEALPFETGSFDAVTCNHGLAHFPRPEAALLELLRVLVPGGRVAFTAWLPTEYSDYFKLVQAAVGQHAPPSPPSPGGLKRFRFGNRAECEEGLRAAGFEDIRVEQLSTVARLEDPRQLLDIVHTAHKSRKMVVEQRPEVRARIEEALTTAARAYERDGVIELAMPMMLASGRKPRRDP